MLYGETVTVLTAGTVADPYSDGTREDWTDPDERDVEGVAVEPRPSSEPVEDARNSVTSGYTLYFPAGDPIGPQNRVRVRGHDYLVMGEPADWRSPFTGWQPGLVVQVERMVG
jgi:hypothetical protein